jgi:hypothetical protein
VGGGVSNEASGVESTIGGGGENKATGAEATVGGGQYNTASGVESTVGGGNSNVASGAGSTVPGGSGNTAAGENSLAAGYRAKANGTGSFVWGDSTDFDIVGNANQFVVRATGGIFMITGVSGSGVPLYYAYLAPNSGAWQVLSDRSVKADFAPVDEKDVLLRLASVPIDTWRYKSQDPSVRHMGPVAQDFHAAFGLGEDEKYISTIDADGVALVAIQGLYKVVQEKEAEIRELRSETGALRRENKDLTGRLNRIERRLAATEESLTAVAAK